MVEQWPPSRSECQAYYARHAVCHPGTGFKQMLPFPHTDGNFFNANAAYVKNLISSHGDADGLICGVEVARTLEWLRAPWWKRLLRRLTKPKP